MCILMHHNPSYYLISCTSILQTKHLHIVGCVYYSIQISGSFPVEVAAKIVERRLDEFNVSLEKHVVCVTDGATMMVKFGKSIPCEHQLCYAHGIYLPACDALYGKNVTVISATASEEMRDEDDSPYLSPPPQKNENFTAHQHIF